MLCIPKPHPLSAFWSLIGYNDTPAHIVFLVSLYMHNSSVFIAQMNRISWHNNFFFFFVNGLDQVLTNDVKQLLRALSKLLLFYMPLLKRLKAQTNLHRNDDMVMPRSCFTIFFFFFIK